VMRTELEARQATVPGWDNKPTARPTAFYEAPVVNPRAWVLHTM
jgi:hypothetical protein